MGIKTLLVELRPVTRDVHLSEFARQRVAVDASCWLHRAALTCAMDLILGRRNLSWLKWWPPGTRCAANLCVNRRRPLLGACIWSTCLNITR